MFCVLAIMLTLRPGLAQSQDELQKEIRALQQRLEALEKQVNANAEAQSQPAKAVTVAAGTNQPVLTPAVLRTVEPSPETSEVAQAAPAAAAPQTAGAPEQAPAAPATPPAPVWSAGPIDFSGMVDGYYNLNFNHPIGRDNQLRNWDTQGNQFGFGMAKFTLNHDPDPVGGRIDFGFGPAFDIINAGEPGGLKYIEQAYVSLKPAKLHGLELDFGKFVTPAGAEVIETMNNWNYSHSLLFAWAIPYFHFGLRASYPVSKTFTATFMVVNGWNNTTDNNTGKTIGISGAWNPNSHFSWAVNYIGGPENNNANSGWRQLFDTVATYTVNDKFAVMANYDYGYNKFPGPSAPTSTPLFGGHAHWDGIAGYAKLNLTKKFAFIPRAEFFNDANGYSTGTTQQVKEVTFTAEYKMMEGLLSRFEYRHDWSDTPFFDRGNSVLSKKLDTLTAGFIVFFGPKR